MNGDVLLIDNLNVKQRTGLHTNIDPKLIEPEIKVAQDIFLQKLIGSNLLEKLQALITAGTLTDTINIPYRKLIDVYIKEVLIYYTMSQLTISLSYQLFNKGLLRKNDDNSNLPTMGEIIDISNGHKDRAEYYGQRLVNYLRANTSLYPEYGTYNTNIDSINPSGESYSTGIWLDDNDNYCGENDVPYWPYKP